jgi:hypothetical protein
MSDTFRDISSDELKSVMLNFMGQNMGDLKQLDNYIVSKNQTLQGVTLDPHKVLNSIAPPTPPPQAPAFNLSPQPVPVSNTPVATAAVPVATPTQSDPNQLEFDFDSSPYSKLIFDRLDNIDRRLEKIIESINNLRTLKKTDQP